MIAGRGVEAVLSVLYVEDNASSVRLVERLMARRSQVRLRVATSGAEGLRLSAESRPDLVLLDLHLPDLAGEVVLRGLQGLPQWGARPFVVLSADALPATEMRLRAAGAADFLVKPLDIVKLYACVDAAQAARRRLRTAC